MEPGPDVGLRPAGSYHDYEINSLLDADAGDTRSNFLDGDSYLSDFNLLNLLATLRIPGTHPRWPISLVGDYVKNLGIDEAVKEEDTGFSMDFFLGRVSVGSDGETGDDGRQQGLDLSPPSQRVRPVLIPRELPPRDPASVVGDRRPFNESPRLPSRG